MAFFGKASPALVEILNRLHSAEKPAEIDHHLYEFGSVHYHVKATASDPAKVYLSLSTPPLSPEICLSKCLPDWTLRDIQRIYSDLVEVANPPKEGFILTLILDITKLPQKKEDRIKAISEISSLQSVILSLQLKNMLWNLGSEGMANGMEKPIKLVYHPKEPFFVIRMPEKITAIFPMRFKDKSDAVLATSFFQELMDVGYSAAYAKAPRCTWSPIPPPQLRGESFQHLTTNGGFVSFDIFSHHVRGAKVERTVWILLNFYAYVKYYVKSTRTFVQRRMRRRMENLTEVLKKARVGAREDGVEIQSRRCLKRLKSFSKSKILRRRCGAFSDQIQRIRSRLRIKALDKLRRRLFKFKIISKKVMDQLSKLIDDYVFIAACHKLSAPPE